MEEYSLPPVSFTNDCTLFVYEFFLVNLFLPGAQFQHIELILC